MGGNGEEATKAGREGSLSGGRFDGVGADELREEV